MSSEAEPKPKRSVSAAIGLAATTVGLVGGIVSLVFVFRPGCQPQAPPDRAAAAISDVSVERGVTFGEYLRRLDYPRGSMSKDFLGRPGALVQFHFVISGFKGKELPLESQLINDDSHHLVSTTRNISIRPGTNAEEADWFVWTPLPKSRHRYHVVVTIEQPDGNVRLRAFPTPSFRGL